MLSPEKLKQIEADAEARYAIKDDDIDALQYVRRRCYISGATAEADKAAAEIAEKDKEIERLKGLMWEAWKGGGNDCECEACIGFWQQFKSENNI